MAAPTDQLVPLHDLDFAPYIDRDVIIERAQAIAKAIAIGYEGRRVRRVCVERGARYFFDLIDQFLWDIAPEMDDIDSLRVSSYKGTESTGSLRWIDFLSKPLDDGLDLIIIEDILDTGRTGNRLIEELGPQVGSIAFVTMLDKPGARIEALTPDATGLVIPNLFVVGSGLDYKVGEVEHGRELSGVYALASERPFADYQIGAINLPVLVRQP